jgi:hypothetical protein
MLFRVSSLLITLLSFYKIFSLSLTIDLYSSQNLALWSYLVMYCLNLLAYFYSFSILNLLMKIVPLLQLFLKTYYKVSFFWQIEVN